MHTPWLEARRRREREHSLAPVGPQALRPRIGCALPPYAPPEPDLEFRRLKVRLHWFCAHRSHSSMTVLKIGFTSASR